VPAVELRIHPAALAEAVAAAEWYSERNPTVAERFERELLGTLERIIEAPLRWPALDERYRRLRVRRFPYAVIYRVVVDAVRVLAVAHGHRHPDYWKSREDPGGI